MSNLEEAGQRAKLVERLRGGDAAAQREFWEVHFGEVCRVCVRMLGAGLVANEMAVEVMTEFLIRYVHHLTRPQAAGAYLRMMAIRRCIRERGRLQAQSHADMDSFLAPTDCSPEEAVQYRVLLPKLEECLEDLTPKAQRVLMLKYFGEMSNEKIGQVLGGSKQYIGRLIRKSQEKLRDCLKDKQVELAGRREPGGGQEVEP